MPIKSEFSSSFNEERNYWDYYNYESTPSSSSTSPSYADSNYGYQGISYAKSVPMNNKYSESSFVSTDCADFVTSGYVDNYDTNYCTMDPVGAHFQRQKRSYGSRGTDFVDIGYPMDNWQHNSRGYLGMS